MKKTLSDFLSKYSGIAHTVLIGWNLFITSWMTGTPLSLVDFGLPYTFDARQIVSYVQLHVHIPTSIVFVCTFLVNATVAYRAWKKKHITVIEVPKGSVAIATPPDTLATVAKKDDTIVKVE
jgi:hypothetical protein